MENYSIENSIRIQATPSDVWNVLTNPDKIVLYTGSSISTNWQTGSPITWHGEMNGMKYINKGRVLENKPDNLLRFTYWSGMGGDIDSPENYSEITYRLTPLNNSEVELRYSRIKIPTVIEKQIFEGHLPFMLSEIKKICENRLS